MRGGHTFGASRRPSPHSTSLGIGRGGKEIGGEALPGGTSGLQIREGRLKLRLVGSTPTLLRQFFEWAGSTSWNKPY